jgi:hypothetical protein
VREAFGGEAFLFVDKPPVENPAAEESAPVQLAMQMIELLTRPKKKF